MASTVPPPDALREFLGPTTRHIRRVEIYESDGITRWEKDTVPRLKGGTVSVDYDRDERRTLDLVLSNDDGALINAPGEFWYDKIIKVFRGVQVNQKIRTPRILVISDKINENVLAPSFRQALTDKGFGDIRVNVLASSYDLDIEPYDIIVGLGAATEAQMDLLAMAYSAGKSVFVQDMDAYRFLGYFGSLPSSSSTTTYITSGGVNAHPVGVGWTRFLRESDTLRTNRLLNPSAELSLDGWLKGNSIILNRTTFSNAVASGSYGVSAEIVNDPTRANSIVQQIASLTASDANKWVMSSMAVRYSSPLNYARISHRFLNDSFQVIAGGNATSTFNPGSAVNSSPSQRYGVVSQVPSGATMVETTLEFSNPNNQGLHPSPGIMHTDAWAVEVANTQEQAQRWISDYFDGTTPSTSDTLHSWVSGASSAHNSQSYKIPLAARVMTSTPSTASIVSSGTSRWILAFEDPDSQGRAITLHVPIVYQQYDHAEFANFLASAFQWLNTTQPLMTWETQIGEFMIDRISEPHFPHEVRITGRDYTKKCLLSKYANATSFSANQTLESVIGTIAASADITKRSLPATGITIGRSFFFERGVSRWAAMKEIATAYDHELFFDAQGYLVLRPYRDPASTAPIVTIETGREGQLASYEKSTTDSRIYNLIVVTGESSDINVIPRSAVRRNVNSKSPTSIAKLGERTYEYSSAFIETAAQASSLANTLLALHSLEEFELSFESLVLPWLEVGDILGWIDPNPAPGDPDTFLLSQLTIPLELAPMSGLGRRVTNVG